MAWCADTFGSAGTACLRLLPRLNPLCPSLQATACSSCWLPSQNNTAHYHYSALLYLAEGGGEDFSGGEFQFMDPEGNFTVVPRAGRVVIFTSGQEHLHRVRPVTQGVRYAISMWFTCDAAMAMPQFLDGKMHNTFHAKREAGKKRQRRHLPRNHRVKAPKDEL